MQDRQQVHVELLASADLFSGLDRIALAKLAAYLDPIPVVEGQDVVVQGQAGESLFLISEGTFGVFINGQEARQIRVATLGYGACFGEMALLTGEMRSATVRALSSGELLQLERQRFLELLRHEPSIGLAISATLSRRLRGATERVASTAEGLNAALDLYLSGLSGTRRDRLLQAVALGPVDERALRAVFGDGTESLLEDLSPFHLDNGAAPQALVEALHQRYQNSASEEDRETFAAIAARHLSEAGEAAAALRMVGRFGSREAFVDLLSEAVERGDLPADTINPFLESITESESAASPHLGLARSRFAAGTNAPALFAEAATQARRRRDWLPAVRIACFAAAAGLVVAAALAAGSSHQLAFLLLLGAAIAMWLSASLPDFAVWLGLVSGWVLLGIATPAQALSGLASASWISALAILGIAAAVANAGLLFRFGLVLIRRMPSGLFGQAVTMLLTGIFLAPLMPSSTARARLIAPIALIAAQNQRLKDQGPESAMLGLCSFVGAVPLLFLFMNGSTSCLLALGLLPEESRAQFDFVRWFLAAAPLALVTGAGWLALAWLVFRPGRAGAASQSRLDLQMALLGKAEPRETAMAVILIATVIGWNVAPSLGIHAGIVGLISLLAAVLAGCFDRRSLQTLNWEFLVSYGVILAMSQISINLGIDREASGMLRDLIGETQIHPLAFVLGVVALNLLVRLALPDDQAVVILSLALLPAASVVGVEPWIVSITLLATFTAWFFPSQTISYLVAYEGAEERLFSHQQARLAYCCYVVAVVAGLVVSVPYWHLLGLL